MILKKDAEITNKKNFPKILSKYIYLCQKKSNRKKRKNKKKSNQVEMIGIVVAMDLPVVRLI